MAKEGKSSNSKVRNLKNRLVLRRILLVVLALVFAGIVLYGVILLYNNASAWNAESFARRLEEAIASGDSWVKWHRLDILEGRNVALLMMLKECNELRANPVFEDMIHSYLVHRRSVKAAPGSSWLRQIDPNWPIDQWDLNRLIEKSDIDYKWILYALAPDKAGITPEQTHMFDPQRWQRRQLTHQLYALTILRQTGGADDELNVLIEHLCSRLANQLFFDIAVVDIYIQKVAFVLRAGFPEKIRRRWVERIIANQLPDGGWNDKWFCFTSDRRPVFGFVAPPSNEHATIQAMIVLYLVRYGYPEHFGLKRELEQ